MTTELRGEDKWIPDHRSTAKLTGSIADPDFVPIGL